MKRGKQVRGNPHWIERDFKKMVKAFGWEVVDVRQVLPTKPFSHLATGSG